MSDSIFGQVTNSFVLRETNGEASKEEISTKCLETLGQIEDSALTNHP